MLARLDLDPVPSRPLSPPLPPEAACTATLSASVLPAALVRLTLSAPCAPSAQVNITHEGMLFSIVTDATGRATALAPALTASAVFQADLGEDGDASVAVTVPDVNDYDRAVLQWRGLAGPEIHAREFGADYGTPGHVWHGAPRSADVAVAGTGGFLMRLGDGQGPNPQMAEVYTFPSIATRQSGKVAFSIETPVSPRTCGHDLKARTIQASPGADPFASDLTIAVPDCQFVGEFLILRDVILNLTVAAR
jgi:hypothetical protein